MSGLRVVGSEQARHYRALFDGLEAAEGREKAARQLFSRHYDQPFIWDLATHPAILNSVEALIGPNIFLLGSQFFCKYGPDVKFVAWHQDLMYWCLEPLEEVTAWYAVDDSDRENGCMQIIPESHDGMMEHGKSRRTGNLLSINQEIDVGPEEESRAVDCVLKAGEISLHHGMAIHGSLPNRSTRRRCGLVLRYIPTHVRPLAPGPTGTDLKWTPVLVRGEDREGNFPSARSRPFPIRHQSE